MMGLENRVRNAVAPPSLGVTAPISPAHGCLLTFDKQQKMVDSLALRKDRHAYSIMIRGISTHLFAARRLNFEQLEAAVSSGFERIEIFALKPHFDYQNKQLTSEIASWFSDHDCL